VISFILIFSSFLVTSEKKRGGKKGEEHFFTRIPPPRSTVSARRKRGVKLISTISHPLSCHDKELWRRGGKERCSLFSTYLFSIVPRRLGFQGRGKKKGGRTTAVESYFFYYNFFYLLAVDLRGRGGTGGRRGGRARSSPGVPSSLLP